MNNIKKQDVSFGQKNEDDVLPVLNRFFDCNLIKTSKYHEFDFIDTNKKIVIELKSRRIARYAYPSTMVGNNKIDSSENYLNKGYKVFFVFKFTDGLFYFKIQENSIEEDWIKIGGRFDRGKDELKQYTFIPCNLLKKI